MDGSLPTGRPLPGWSARPLPDPVVLEGRWARLERLGSEHAAALAREVCGEESEPLWTYLTSERPTSPAELDRYLSRRLAEPGMVSVAVVPRTGPAAGTAAGLASLMRLEPEHGVVEVGAILYGERLQRTVAATEAMYLLAQHVFDLGYRRYEWKCDDLNAASRSAAARLGFRYEGTFRNAVVYKGRNRDTAWFSITDDDWVRLRPAFDQWLEPANFADPVAGDGPRQSLSALTASALARSSA